MTVRQQLVEKTKKKRCIYCQKYRFIGELDRIDFGAWQCPEHDVEKKHLRLEDVMKKTKEDKTSE